MADNALVITLLQTNLSYTKTAQEIGVSKQRIYQIAKSYAPALITEINEKRVVGKQVPCQVCGKSMRLGILTTGPKTCHTCVTYERYNTYKTKRMRHYLLSPVCAECGYQFQGYGKRTANYKNVRYVYEGKTICRFCYGRTPEQNAHRKAYQQKPGVKEAIRRNARLGYHARMANPTYRREMNSKRRTRYATDAEFRGRVLASQKRTRDKLLTV